MGKWLWLSKQFASKLWFRASIFCIVGIFTALLGLILKDYIPKDISNRVGADAVDSILQILASSMLAVTTFSLSTVVAAYSAASSNATPRATKLLLEDSTAQNALSTFIGSFLYSLVGIIALHMGLYGESGRVVLFMVTLCVIFIIVAMLLQWIEHLSQLGRIGHTIYMVEKATQKSFDELIKSPCLGGSPYSDKGKDKMQNGIKHPRIGYVEFIDMASLSSLAKKRATTFYINASPGHFNDSEKPVLYSVAPLEDDDDAIVREAFTIGDARSFNQDPRYGLIVLGEIASRALSPAVNDPGTAIVVIGTAVRILSQWAKHIPADTRIRYPEIYVKSAEADSLFDDIFTPIARDGAGMVEVGIRLQKAFASLAAMGNEECKRAATKYASLSLHRAMAALTLPEDKEHLRNLDSLSVHG